MKDAVMTASIAAGAAVSNVINVQGYEKGTLSVPATWSSAFIAFKARLNTADTLVGLYDRSNGLVKVGLVNPSRVVALPEEVFGAREIQLWSVNASNADSNQTAAVSVKVYLDND